MITIYYDAPDATLVVTTATGTTCCYLCGAEEIAASDEVALALVQEVHPEATPEDVERLWPSVERGWLEYAAGREHEHLNEMDAKGAM
jgi:hypothetical protein